MRKLHLASFKFKVGDNEFEELRLFPSYATGYNNVLEDAIAAWNNEARLTERHLMSACLRDLDPIEEQRANKPSFTIKELSQAVKSIKAGKSEFSGIKYEINHKIFSDKDHSVFFVRNDDPDNAVIAGYGGSYTEALKDFSKKLYKSEYILDDNLQFQRVES